MENETVENQRRKVQQFASKCISTKSDVGRMLCVLKLSSNAREVVSSMVMLLFYCKSVFGELFYVVAVLAEMHCDSNTHRSDTGLSTICFVINDHVFSLVVDTTYDS